MSEAEFEKIKPIRFEDESQKTMSIISLDQIFLTQSYERLKIRTIMIYLKGSYSFDGNFFVLLQSFLENVNQI